MPVDDLPISDKVRFSSVPLAGCHSERLTRDAYYVAPLEYRTFTGEIVPAAFSTSICRQVGRKFNGAWVPLDDCMGCKQPKDWDYINKSRKDIDEEFK